MLIFAAANLVLFAQPAGVARMLSWAGLVPAEHHGPAVQHRFSGVSGAADRLRAQDHHGVAAEMLEAGIIDIGEAVRLKHKLAAAVVGAVVSLTATAGVAHAKVVARGGDSAVIAVQGPNNSLDFYWQPIGCPAGVALGSSPGSADQLPPIY